MGRIIMKELNRLSVYLVIGRDDCVFYPPVEIVQQALAAGIKAVQLREKSGNMKDIIAFGKEIRKLTKEHQALFFVNDRIDLAQILEADGIHLGQEDLPIHEVKKIIPSGFKIGISARTVKDAIEAEKAGADYLGVGAVYPTGTKKNAKYIGLEGIKGIKDAVSIPIVAIGGISEGRVGKIRKYGADGIAVVSAISKSKKPFQSAKKIMEEWEE